MSDTMPIEPIVEETSAVAPTAVVPARRVTLPRIALRRRIGGALAGLTAVGVKELRGRMRGRRAFVILTTYLLLLAGFAWMMELILERRYSGTLANSAAYASAQIGQGIFVALLMLETLLVVALAPAFTAGAISMEREKQTLDMLATTPISSLSIVVGKLFSALTYLFILVFASIPLTAVVFVFGGVAPDDVVRGYAVLLSTAIGLGSLGIFFSALVKRTQAATIITYFGVMAATLGAFFVFFFWNTMTNGSGFASNGFGPIKGRPPEALLYLNPYFAQADVVCGVENGFGDWCDRVGFVSDRSIFNSAGFGSGGNSSGVIVRPVPGLQKGGGVITQPDDPSFGFVDDSGIQPFGVHRDGFWPKTAIAWLGLSVVLILATVQLVSPTRRWRFGIGRLLRRRRASPA